MNSYMIVADGAGEYDVDFSVTWIDAPSPEAAAEIAVSPEMGYGRRDGGKLYVIPVEAVAQFSTQQRIVTVLEKDEGDE